MKKIILLFSFIFFAIISCEKDDICNPDTTLTTPRLIVHFFDVNNPFIPKNVTDLKVVGDEMEDGIIFDPVLKSDITNANSIALPLKTNQDSTKYKLILNSKSSNPFLKNQDNITIYYTRENIFVSRACGFKTNFILNNQQPITHIAEPVTNPKWIRNIIVKNLNITNENEAHINFYF